MLRRHIIVSVLALIICTTTNALPDTRIVGGESTAIRHAPYQVSLQYKSPICPLCYFSHLCGGTILSESIVLTTAHCVDERVAKSFMVVAGRDERTGSKGYLVPVERIIMHEKYNIWTVDNDVAILKLGAILPLSVNGISSIPLAKVLPPAGQLATITGWGSLEHNGDHSETLRRARVPIVGTEQCKAFYDRDEITERMFCAGFQDGGVDACQGDSGGPLVYNGELVGMVSWGSGCARPEFPTVYASVPAMNDWISNKMTEN